jgi:hypothetical protein
MQQSCTSAGGVKAVDKHTTFIGLHIFDRPLFTRRRRPPRSSHAIFPDFWGAMKKYCNTLSLSLQCLFQGLKAVSPLLQMPWLNPDLPFRHLLWLELPSRERRSTHDGGSDIRRSYCWYIRRWSRHYLGLHLAQSCLALCKLIKLP